MSPENDCTDDMPSLKRELERCRKIINDREQIKNLILGILETLTMIVVGDIVFTLAIIGARAVIFDIRFLIPAQLLLWVGYVVWIVWFVKHPWFVVIIDDAADGVELITTKLHGAVRGWRNV